VADGFGAAPLFVDKGMLDRLRPLGGEVIVALPSPAARAADMAAEPKAEASGLPGPAAHREIAGTLAPILAAQARLPLLLLRHAKTAL
jgi:hypothetical protein